MPRLDYECLDGTPFPVEFETEADAALTWKLDREHNPDPRTPLGEALERLADEGAARAYAEVGMVRPSGFRPGPHANGFAYWCVDPVPPEEMAAMFEGGRALVERHGSANGVWRERCLPEVKADCAAIAGAGPGVPLTRLAEVQGHGMHLTMVPAYLGGHDRSQLEAALADVVGGDAARVSYELTQGHQSETLRADAALWRLGRLARSCERVADALGAARPAAAMAELRTAGKEPAFFAALDGFLADFGGRAEGWDIAKPTWGEQGDGLWAQLRQLSSPGAPDPAEAVRRSARRREARVAEIEAALAGDAERLARFRRRLERLSTYVAVREERAHWQLALYGALRGVVLARGASMVAGGMLDAADDVLYLLPEEIEGGVGRNGFRSLVAERRAERDRWMRVTPPETIGRPPDGDRDAIAARTVTGVAASRGTATGPARVVTDLADAGRVEPGDVLVCVMTSPPWTPLFGIVAAVVADSGDIGSHVAIAAREYGIPCVLGTAVGTAAIPDGATVTVDGDAGRVDVRPA